MSIFESWRNKAELGVGSRPTYLTASSIDVAFGAQQVLQDVSFTLHKYDYVALVGPNGAGKTTLMRVLAGVEEPDRGKVVIPRNLRVTYIPQAIGDLDIDPTISVGDYFLRARGLDVIQERMTEIESMLEVSQGEEYLDEYGILQHEFQLKGGYDFEREISFLLEGVGLPVGLDQYVENLSGGQKAKLFFAQTIYAQPDIILMDEPTNHIDEASKAWLGNYLDGYPGAILIISHDPDFLNPLINKSLELQPFVPGITEYKGDYEQFIRLKSDRDQWAIDESERTQDELSRQSDIAARLHAGSRAKSGKSREKLIVRLREKADTVLKKVNAMSIRFEIEKPSGKNVILTQDLGKIYDAAVLTYPDIQIQRGQNTAVIGPIGAGKSTLLKLLSQRIYPDQGEIRYGSNIQIGYYDQEHAELDFNMTIFGELQRTRPDLSDQTLRTVLGHFLFSGDTVFKPVSVLSEGEKSRVALAKLVVERNNVLMLDEPTNHLDVRSKARLLEALQGYAGTLIVVTHDQDLLSGLHIHQIIYLPEGRIELV